MEKVSQRLASECRSYRDLIEAFSEGELYQIARIKRFVECLSGDIIFRKQLLENPDRPEARKRLQKIGVEFASDELMPLWAQPEEIDRYHQQAIDPLQNMEEEPDIDIDLEQWPLIRLWLEWLKANSYLIRKHLLTNPEIPQNACLNAWRQRRIASGRSELGLYGRRIDYPVFAFELSRGCSIGCWFCGFSAKKLSGIFPYTPENRSFWHDLVQTGVDLVGAEAAGWALCYYGTEPYDNPHYLDFLKDYREITGSALCTATAAPLKDPNWTRQLLAFYREDDDGPLPWPRFSVLSSSILRRIHETYTPDELRDVNLLIQTKKSPHMKAVSGRLLHGKKEKLGAQEIPDDTPFIPQGSISCISGFLVNMVDRTIKLISPCYADDRWPLGYRVYAEETFETVADYRAAIERIIAKHMTEDIASTKTSLTFRDDLQCILQPDGFTLLSRHQKHHLRGNGIHRQMGELLGQGNKTYQELVGTLSYQNDSSVVDASRILTKLFDRGLLDETRIECRA